MEIGYDVEGKGREEDMGVKIEKGMMRRIEEAAS